MMVGKDLKPVERESVHDRGNVLFEIRNLNRPAETPFAVALRNISLQVNAGDIIGIAGVAGNGQSEFFEAVSGEVLQSEPDMVRLCGTDAGKLGIGQRRGLGAAFVPEERLGHGAVPSLALSKNLLLSRHSSDQAELLGPAGWVQSERLTAKSRGVIEALDVRCGGPDPAAGTLSGGNLQKFIIGRELDRQPRVLLVNQPTWGVDAGAAAHIRQALIELARNGSAVVLISQDLDELFEVCDAMAVMHDGELSEPIPREQATLETIGLLMGGATAGSAA